jgi:hypothetical protein
MDISIVSEDLKVQLLNVRLQILSKMDDFNFG